MTIPVAIAVARYYAIVDVVNNVELMTGLAVVTMTIPVAIDVARYCAIVDVVDSVELISDIAGYCHCCHSR